MLGQVLNASSERIAIWRLGLVSEIIKKLIGDSLNFSLSNSLVYPQPNSNHFPDFDFCLGPLLLLELETDFPLPETEAVPAPFLDFETDLPASLELLRERDGIDAFLSAATFSIGAFIAPLYTPN